MDHLIALFLRENGPPGSLISQRKWTARESYFSEKMDRQGALFLRENGPPESTISQRKWATLMAILKGNGPLEWLFSKEMDRQKVLFLRENGPLGGLFSKEIGRNGLEPQWTW
jgi:hypothetical protein